MVIINLLLEKKLSQKQTLSIPKSLLISYTRQNSLSSLNETLHQIYGKHSL